jgi:hypothetical protein
VGASRSFYVASLVSGRGWWFSSLLLWRIKEMRVWIAKVLMSISVFVMRDFGILYVLCNVDIAGVWMVPHVSTVIIMIGSTCQPRCFISAMSGRYLFVLFWILFLKNQSFLYVYSINWIVIFGCGCSGGRFMYGCLRIHSMSGLNLALQKYQGI